MKQSKICLIAALFVCGATFDAEAITGASADRLRKVMAPTSIAANVMAAITDQEMATINGAGSLPQMKEKAVAVIAAVEKRLTAEKAAATQKATASVSSSVSPSTTRSSRTDTAGSRPSLQETASHLSSTSGGSHSGSASLHHSGGVSHSSSVSSPRETTTNTPTSPRSAVSSREALSTTTALSLPSTSGSVASTVASPSMVSASATSDHISKHEHTRVLEAQRDAHEAAMRHKDETHAQAISAQRDAHEAAMRDKDETHAQAISALRAENDHLQTAAAGSNLAAIKGAIKGLLQELARPGNWINNLASRYTDAYVKEQLGKKKITPGDKAGLYIKEKLKDMEKFIP